MIIINEFFFQNDEEYTDLTILFTESENSEEVLKFTPTVRLYFKFKWSFKSTLCLVLLTLNCIDFI